MASTLKTLREDNLVVLGRLRNRLPEEHHVDLDELLGLAEYLVPVRSIDFAADPSRDEVEAIIEWADADADTLRRAWMLAVHRCGAHEMRWGTVELLATALHRAEEHATPSDPRLLRPAPAQGTRPRVTARFRQLLGSA
jgi:hypothetical protein